MTLDDMQVTMLHTASANNGNCSLIIIVQSELFDDQISK